MFHILEAQLETQTSQVLMPTQQLQYTKTKNQTLHHHKKSDDPHFLPNDKQTVLVLGKHFIPGDYDVICGRGKQTFTHQGNKHLRSIVQMYSKQYSQAATKTIRTNIVTEVIQWFKARGSGFVKKDPETGIWTEAGEVLIREKVGQHFRNCLGNKYLSNGRKRHQRRVVAKSQFASELHGVLESSPKISNAIESFQKDVSDVNPSSLSDENAMKLFERHNKQMLNILKNDTSLTEKFNTLMAGPGPN